MTTPLPAETTSITIEAYMRHANPHERARVLAARKAARLAARSLMRRLTRRLRKDSR